LNVGDDLGQRQGRQEARGWSGEDGSVGLAGFVTPEIREPPAKKRTQRRAGGYSASAKNPIRNADTNIGANASAAGMTGQSPMRTNRPL
jgi:hypothetical protein